MFQQGESPTPPGEKMYVGLRILMVAGAGLLLAFGLCGVGAFVPSLGSSGLGSAAGSVSIAGLVVFLLSLLLLVIGVITLVVELIARR